MTRPANMTVLLRQFTLARGILAVVYPN